MSRRPTCTNELTCMYRWGPNPIKWHELWLLILWELVEGARIIRHSRCLHRRSQHINGKWGSSEPAGWWQAGSIHFGSCPGQIGPVPGFQVTSAPSVDRDGWVVRRHKRFTLQSNVAVENPWKSPRVKGFSMIFPFSTSIYKGLSIGMFDCQVNQPSAA